ncbi:hypothetical protein CCP3SC15_1170008 [Gammaproteobacteria bacterium]
MDELVSVRYIFAMFSQYGGFLLQGMQTFRQVLALVRHFAQLSFKGLNFLT